jgi:hypothetical protein
MKSVLAYFSKVLYHRTELIEGVQVMEVKCQLSFIIYSQNPVKKDDLIEQINGRKSLEVILEK